MRLLLDTHVLVWSMDTRFMPDAIGAILTDPANEILVSAVSVTEIAIKHGTGALPASPRQALDHIARRRFSGQPFTLEAAARLSELPPHHRDPFDRMLMAHALALDAILVSVDDRIALYATHLPVIARAGVVLRG